jgi:pyruvate,water dikinase
VPDRDQPIIELSELRATDAGRAGPKLARLGELRSRGWQVPDGYVVTAAAFQACLTDRIRTRLHDLLADLPDDPDGLTEVSTAARDLLEDQALPQTVIRAIAAAHERLAQRTGAGDDLVVAVRSSAVAEDAATASFAGQFDTYLGIRGADDVLHNVRRCFSSLYTPRALVYRRRRGLAPADGGFAVGVLQLVEARSAGVLFTLDPASGARDRVVIEGSWGLGETVVAGLVTPDHWSVKKDSGRIRERHISDKRVQLVFDTHRSQAVEVGVPDELATQPCLTDDEVRYLCRRAAELEAIQGMPQDIEWAVHRGMDLPGSVFFLQHRPETTWGEVTGTDGAAFDPVEYALRTVLGVPRP